ncbi:MAG: efflux RND transporter periplasmic adaptor subunit [Saprospiraceae bacterium]
MKNILSILAVVLIFTACGSETKTEWPADLAGKKTLLREKKAELKSMQSEIDSLMAQIEKLDTKQEKKRRLVTTQGIKKQDFNRFVDMQGTVESGEAVMASSETGGRITQLNVEEGQFVSKGKLIARVDMESVNKQIAEMETSLGLLVDVYERQQRLWDQKIGSELQLLKAKNDKERVEKSLETARFQLTKANVYAPISGVVDMVFLKSGEMAGPGSPIVQILDTRTVKVVANLPENYLGVIKKGEQVTVKFPAIGEERKARVSLIGRTINPANRTFEVEVELNNKKGVLKPNLLALMMINDYSKKDAIILPLVVVQQDVSGKSFVYVNEKGDEGPMAKKVYLETGESYEGNIIITEGLKGDEEIIVDGARGLSNGDLIKIDEAKSPLTKAETK